MQAGRVMFCSNAERIRAFLPRLCFITLGCVPTSFRDSPDTIRRGKPKVVQPSLELTSRPGGLCLVAEEGGQAYRSHAVHPDQ